MKEDVTSKLAKVLYVMAVMLAKVSVNTTCCGTYYQEKQNPQLNSLRKYHDK